MGRSDRQGCREPLRQREAQPVVAQAQAALPPGVRRRRLDGSARRPPAVRLAARRVLRRERDATGGSSTQGRSAPATTTRNWIGCGHCCGPLATTDCPFAVTPQPPERPTGCRPELVVEVKFTEWTDEGYLRHPVYLGLRDDVPADEVRREPRPARLGPATSVEQERAAPGAASRNQRTSARARVARDAPGGPAAAHGRGVESRTDTRSGPGDLLPGDTGLAPLIAQLQALEDARRDGTLALPDGTRLDVTNLAKVFWPVPARHQGRTAALLRAHLALAAARRRRSSAHHEAVSQRRHRQDVLPAARAGRGAAGRAGRVGGGRRRADAAAGRRIVAHAALHDAAGGHLAGSVVLAGAVARRRRLRRARPRSDAGRAVRTGARRRAVRGRRTRRIGVAAVPKTSGSSGLHIYVPLVPGTTYEAGQLFCQIVATLVATRHPKLATVERTVSRRGRTVYVDYLQNIEGKTLATVYSARASEFAGVSTPLRWDELGTDLRPEDFTIRSVAARFREAGNLWDPLHGTRRVDLRQALERLASRY